MVQIKKAYADVGCSQVHLRRTDTTHGGLPIVLLHQTASSSEMFERLMMHLGARFDCYALDTPGFGQSDALAGVGSIKGYADRLLEALDAIGLESCGLVGHHTGASIAVQMVATRPRFVRKLALSGPPLLTDSQASELMARAASTELDPDGAYLGTTWQRVRQKDTSVPLELIDREVRLTLGAGPRWAEGYQAVCEHREFEVQLREIQCPTMLLSGDRDTLFPMLEAAYECIRDGQMRVLPNQTTYVFDVAPELIADPLMSFFI